jgi:hypothetical protein
MATKHVAHAVHFAPGSDVPVSFTWERTAGSQDERLGQAEKSDCQPNLDVWNRELAGK